MPEELIKKLDKKISNNITDQTSIKTNESKIIDQKSITSETLKSDKTYQPIKNENKVDNENFVGQKFLEIVNQENKIVKELSIKYNCDFADNENLIEKNDENFVDSIHFSHLGMEKIAKNFFKKVKIYLEH